MFCGVRVWVFWVFFRGFAGTLVFPVVLLVFWGVLCFMLCYWDFRVEGEFLVWDLGLELWFMGVDVWMLVVQ